MKKLLEEFKTFALKGNVLDMAVGVVVGGAFTSIVNSVVADVDVYKRQALSWSPARSSL